MDFLFIAQSHLKKKKLTVTGQREDNKEAQSNLHSSWMMGHCVLQSQGVAVNECLMAETLAAELEEESFSGEKDIKALSQ